MYINKDCFCNYFLLKIVYFVIVIVKKKKLYVVNMQRLFGCGVFIFMCIFIIQFMNLWFRKYCVGSWGEGNEVKIEIVWELGCLL